jgi:AbiV family abortive infection protein
MDKSDYNKIFDNGAKHIECAKVLAARQMLGFAISHIILGIEELIKYQVVMTKSVNNYSFDDVIDPKKRNSIFRDHVTKHNLLKEFQESISDEFANEFLQTLVLRSNEEELIEDTDVLKNRFKEWGAFFATVGSEMNIPNEERQNFFNWLKNANEKKNNGFYANLKNNILESPCDIKIEEYETAIKYASCILKQTEFMKSVDLSDDEFIKLLNSDG